MFLRVVLLALCAGTLFGQLPPEARFVMSHFKANGGGGDERLYISWSADGLNWTGLNSGNFVWEPENPSPFNNVVRDPSIVFANGFYWVCYTQGNYGRGNKFGLVKSTDLLNWTQVGPIALNLNAPNPFTWSPSFFVDGDGSVHVLVSFCPDRPFDVYAGMRIYETHPNANWTEWSDPVAVQLPDVDPITNEFFGWKEGDVYHCVYIRFSGGVVVHATSADLLSGWVRDRELGYGGQEGPFVLPKPAGGYRLYLEPGNQSGPITTYRWCDFDGTFTSATEQADVTSTIPMRNGKPCAARNTLSFAAWQTQQLGAVPVERREPLADADDDGLPNLIEHGLGTVPTAFTEPSRRPQGFLRNLAGVLYPGLVFDWFRSSADVAVRAEVRLVDGSWSAAPGDLVIEGQTLLSDGLTRTSVRAAQPVGSGPVFLRVAATQSAAAPALSSQSLALPASRKRAKPILSR